MKRLLDVRFGEKSKAYDFVPPVVTYGDSVTDDSHFVPRVKQVRDFVASGGAPSSDLRFDSDFGDDVSVPKLNRSVSIDPVDADIAANEIIQEAKSKADKAAKEKADKELSDALKSQSEFIDNLKQDYNSESSEE